MVVLPHVCLYLIWNCQDDQAGSSLIAAQVSILTFYYGLEAMGFSLRYVTSLQVKVISWSRFTVKFE
jgi:hypothetical protein